jgi:hypothetical protein
MTKRFLLIAALLSLSGSVHAAVINAYWSFNDSNFDVTAFTAGSVWATSSPTLSTSFTGDGTSTFENASSEIPQPFTAFNGTGYNRVKDSVFTLDNRDNGISTSAVTMTDPTITFGLDMTNLEDLTMRMDVRPSELSGGDTANASQSIEYNIGAGWLDTGQSISGLAVNDPNVVNLDFSGVSAIEGQSNVQLRIVWDDLTAGAANNNNDLAKLEFDNVQIEATVIPEPQASVLLLGALVFFAATRRSRRLS